MYVTCCLAKRCRRKYKIFQVHLHEWCLHTLERIIESAANKQSLTFLRIFLLAELRSESIWHGRYGEPHRQTQVNIPCLPYHKIIMFYTSPKPEMHVPKLSCRQEVSVFKHSLFSDMVSPESLFVPQSNLNCSLHRKRINDVCARRIIHTHSYRSTLLTQCES